MALQPVTNPRIAKLIELEVSGRIRPEHQQELDTYRAQGFAPKKGAGGALTEAEGKSAGFYNRALESDRDFINAGEGGSPRGILGDAAAAILPSNIVNSNTSEERQRANQAKENFIRASLRYESGAAIGKDEFAAQDQIFFPQTGDSPEVIAQKAKARQEVIESLRVSAGAGAGRVDGSEMAPVVRSAARASSVEAPLKGVPDDVRAAYVALARLPSTSPDDLRAFWERNGFKLENADDIVEARTKGAGVAADPVVNEAKPKATGSGAAFARGVVDTATLGTGDEIAGAIDTAGQIWNEGLGGRSFRDVLYSNIDRNRADMRYDEENNGTARFAGQLAGGFILPGAGAATSGLRGAATVGALYGGAYGFGSGEGDPVERVPNALLGTGLGAAGGSAAYGVGAGVRSLASRFPGGGGGSGGSGGGNALAVLDAADRLRVSMLPADVGGAGTKVLTSAFGQAPLSAAAIQRGSQRSIDSIASARRTIASGQGVILPADEAGEAVRKGAELYSRTTSQRGSRLYDRAFREAGNVQITPANGIAAIDDAITRYSQSGDVSKPLIDELERLKGALGKGVSVVGARDIRSFLGPLASSDKLRGTPAKKVFGDVLDAISQDIDGTLRQQGKARAADTFKIADNFWRERVEQIDSVLEPIVGAGKSGEDILRAVDQMTRGGRGGVQRLSRLLGSLPNDEAANVRATLIDKLGRARKDNGETDTFSPLRFVSQWDEEMSPKAKAALFGDPALRSALDDLATVSRAAKAADAYRSRSNTPAGIWGNITAVGGAGVYAGGPLGAILGLGGQYVTGRVLASPKLVRGIARIARANTRQSAIARINQLPALAARDPAVGPDAAALQNFLLNMLEASPSRAAANEPDRQ